MKYKDKNTSLLVKCNLAFVLADVVDTLMMQFEAESAEIGKGLKQEAKMKFNQMQRSAKAFKASVKNVSREGYSIKQADSFCDDSDWLTELLLLLVDRVGDNEEKMTKVKAMIFNIRSENG